MKISKSLDSVLIEKGKALIDEVMQGVDFIEDTRKLNRQIKRIMRTLERRAEILDAENRRTELGYVIGWYFAPCKDGLREELRKYLLENYDGVKFKAHWPHP